MSIKIRNFRPSKKKRAADGRIYYYSLPTREFSWINELLNAILGHVQRAT